MNTYAVYKDEYDCHYILEYIDNILKLKNYPYINKKDLPVVINKLGGYHHFDISTEDEFLEFRTGDEDDILTFREITPINSRKFKYGWIAPNGDTYSCGYEDHIKVADIIYQNITGKPTDNGEQELEKLGFVKVTYDMHTHQAEILPGMGFRGLTQQQIDKAEWLGLNSSRYAQTLLNLNR